VEYPNPNMLLRTAQGDAYAMALEYADTHESLPVLRENALRFEGYLAHPTHLQVAAGQYTDDTQMSIAVAEVLNDHTARGTEPTTQDFANAFFRAYARDPRYGYSRALQKLLGEVSSAEEWQQRLVPTSDKNGAAMRSVPLGVLADPERILRLAKTQAVVTHNTEGGIHSSMAVALMSNFALYSKADFGDMHAFCTRLLPAFEPFKETWTGPVGTPDNDRLQRGVGMCTAHAVHTLLVEEHSLLDMMKRLLVWGGDTDSVAAIAWGIASARYPNEALPSFFERDLEPNGKYGAAFLKDLGARLFEVARVSS